MGEVKCRLYLVGVTWWIHSILATQEGDMVTVTKSSIVIWATANVVILYVAIRVLQPVQASNLLDVKLKGGVINEAESDILAEKAQILKHIPRGARVLEVGANVGRSTFVAASVAARVYSSEALPENFKVLQENIRAHGLQDKVKLLPAISDAPIYSLGGWDTSAEDTEPGKQKTHKEAGKKIRLPAVSVQTILSKYDIILADCEGCFHKLARMHPQILDGAHTLLMEDDAHEQELREWLRSDLIKRGFRRVECSAADVFMPWLVGFDYENECFYAVWKKKAVQGLPQGLPAQSAEQVGAHKTTDGKF